MGTLPGWLYEPLPYIYVITGLFTAFNLDILLGRVSGLLLISAGVIVWHLRFQFRRDVRRRKLRKQRRITTPL